MMYVAFSRLSLGRTECEKKDSFFYHALHRSFCRIALACQDGRGIRKEVEVQAALSPSFRLLSRSHWWAFWLVGDKRTKSCGFQWSVSWRSSYGLEVEGGGGILGGLSYLGFHLSCDSCCGGVFAAFLHGWHKVPACRSHTVCLDQVAWGIRGV
jgi:hypothetical protein